MDVTNWQAVGANGRGEVIVALPRSTMSRGDALIHAAWLVAVTAAEDEEFLAVLREVQSA